MNAFWACVKESVQGPHKYVNEPRERIHTLRERMDLAWRAMNGLDECVNAVRRTMDGLRGGMNPARSRVNTLHECMNVVWRTQNALRGFVNLVRGTVNAPLDRRSLVRGSGGMTLIACAR
jgi:hypothetical protein